MEYTSTHRRKEAQLGMKLGTACAKLRKSLMFSMAVRLGENICFKCKGIIETPREITIEHKKPWLGGDTGLFWDLDNIAFSHARCNRPDRPKNGAHLSHAPSPHGMSWCTGHKDHALNAEFSINSSNWNGLQHFCRKCKDAINAKRDRRKRFAPEGKVEEPTDCNPVVSRFDDGPVLHKILHAPLA